MPSPRLIVASIHRRNALNPQEPITGAGLRLAYLHAQWDMHNHTRATACTNGSMTSNARTLRVTPLLVQHVGRAHHHHNGQWQGNHTATPTCCAKLHARTPDAYLPSLDAHRYNSWRATWSRLAPHGPLALTAPGHAGVMHITLLHPASPTRAQGCIHSKSHTLRATPTAAGHHSRRHAHLGRQ